MTEDEAVSLNYTIIENGIREALRRQEKLTQDFASSGDELAEADIAFKRAWAIARHNYRKETNPLTKKAYAQDALEDMTVQATHEEYARYMRAKAIHDAARQALNSVRTRVDSLRSLMASYRTLTD